jgi:hypothetical protein
MTALVVLLSLARPLAAQRASSILKFAAGGAAALALHESGHVAFDLAYGAHPYFKRVELGGVPFFAIAQRDDVRPREEMIISSAGFWMQELSNELLLTRHPRLRDERAPFLTGALAFNVLNSVGYAMVAFRRAGPPERDTRSIADAINRDERTVGVVILVPALLDAARYAKPESRWLPWASRTVKLAGALWLFRTSPRAKNVIAASY